MQSDAIFSCYEFQNDAVESISWMSDNTELADTLAKKDSSSTRALQLTILTGKLSMKFNSFA